jgi:hypothetical protein
MKPDQNSKIRSEQTCAAQCGWLFATKLSPFGWASISPVVALAIALGSLGLLSSVARAQVPVINQPLVPDAVAPGGPAFNLTVNGTGFVTASVVNWNGGALTTQFVSGSQLTATVPAEEIATAGTASITVVNPVSGGGTSNIAYLTVATPPASLLFGPAYSVASNIPFSSMAAGDFKGNGKIDLALASFSGRTVSILQGNGDGTFQSPVMYSAGLVTGPPVSSTGPTLLVTCNLSHDGKTDVATYLPPARDVNPGLWALLGDQTVANDLYLFVAGDVTEPIAAYGGSLAVGLLFGAVSVSVCSIQETTIAGTTIAYFVCGYPSSPAIEAGYFAAGDFNGDGFLDLAVTNPYENTVSILLGDSAGNFTLGSITATGLNPSSIGVGDFNGDGKLDLAVVNSGSNTVSILLGDGAGNFTLASSPATGVDPVSLALGDFNNDGNLDLAVANNQSGTVSVLVGDGTGNFALAASPTILSPVSIAVGDFNSDGRLDLAVDNSILLQSTTVALSPTNLSFGTQSIGVTGAPQTVTLSNTGDATLTISGLAASGDFAQTNTCASSVRAGASCTVSVTFTPTASGTRTGTITINDNAPGSPQTVSLTGTGTGPVATLSATSLSLGAEDVGTTSAAHTLMLTNRGNITLGISGVTISPASFSETNTCGRSVAPGASCTIAVTFTPSMAGATTGTLSIADTAFGSPHRVALSGVGQDFTIGTYLLAQTVPAGLTAEYPLAVAPLGGFNHAVAYTCSGAPQQASCSVTPTSTTLDGRNYATIVLRVTTTAPAGMLPTGDRPWNAPSCWVLALLGSILLLLTLLASAVRKRLALDFTRRLRLLTPLAAVAPIILLWIACGGGGTVTSPPVTGGTPSGEYTITVTATSGHLSHAATVQMTVR